MSKKPLSVMSAWLLPLAVCLGSQTAFAQRAHRPVIRIMSAPVSATAAPALPPYFRPLQAAFSEAYPVVSVNADGSDLWPCLGRSSSIDCPTVGSPAIPLPANALVVGFPGYGYALKNTASIGNGVGCDALVNGTGAGGVPYAPCAQFLTWHEDNTGDTTDDILWRVTVRQGGTVVYASGLVDFGPIGTGRTYPLKIVIYDDANLGYWPGADVGPENGNCFGDEFYPLTKPAFPGGLYVIGSGKTCGRPHAGAAQVESQTILATPSYTQVTGTACTGKGVASPCYVVSYVHRREMHQNFSFLLN